MLKKKTNQLMSQVFKEILNNRFVILSGPNFSDEVTKGLPTATVISCENSKTAKEISIPFLEKKSVRKDTQAYSKMVPKMVPRGGPSAAPRLPLTPSS